MEIRLIAEDLTYSLNRWSLLIKLSIILILRIIRNNWKEDVGFSRLNLTFGNNGIEVNTNFISLPR